MDANATDIAHVIQLSIAPVFLLVGIGSFINVFAGRLSRIVDRSRVLEARAEMGDESSRAEVRAEIGVLCKRATLVYVGITLGILSALLVCLLIVLGFTGHFFGADMENLIGALFTGAMLALIGSLLVFLREVFLGVRNLAIGRED
jgi:hypothetical protein